MNRIKNYIGTTIDKFKILNQKRENNITYLYCKCLKCGKERWIAQKHIKSTKCCESNIASTQFKPYIPDTNIINNIEIIEPTRQRYNNREVIWKCKCYCGNIFYAPITYIKRGRIKSCGCSHIESQKNNLKKATSSFKEKNLKEGTSLSAITPKIIKTNTSGITGVMWDKTRKKWKAEIEFKGKRHYLGRYTKKEDAIKARKEAEEKYFKPILDKYNKKQKNGSKLTR